jgi:uncharacterized protein YggU (UPF0235/DUF167 family)
LVFGQTARQGLKFLEQGNLGLVAAALPGFQRGMTDLTHLVLPGAMIAIRVTPNARRPGVEPVEGQIRIAVTETPEAGKATEAARAALAKALGVAKTRLTLVRGATARDKLYRLD